MAVKYLKQKQSLICWSIKKKTMVFWEQNHQVDQSVRSFDIRWAYPRVGAQILQLWLSQDTAYDAFRESLYLYASTNYKCYVNI